MKRTKKWFYLLFLFGIPFFSGSAGAALTVIGTVTYYDTDYKLIYDADAPFGPITWLDFTKNMDFWQDQVDWAAGLNDSGVLTYNLNPGVSITWNSGWRLPKTLDGPYEWGYDGTTTAGCNITTSEMGHLYYESLGNLGYYAKDGTNPQPGWGLINTGDFDNLLEDNYWSGTIFSLYPVYSWVFSFSSGHQEPYDIPYFIHYAMAVRPGEVPVVPLPSAMLLLASGLAGLGLFRRVRR